MLWGFQKSVSECSPHEGVQWAPSVKNTFGLGPVCTSAGPNFKFWNKVRHICNMHYGLWCQNIVRRMIRILWKFGLWSDAFQWFVTTDFECYAAVIKCLHILDSYVNICDWTECSWCCFKNHCDLRGLRVSVFPNRLRIVLLTRSIWSCDLRGLRAFLFFHVHIGPVSFLPFL